MLASLPQALRCRATCYDALCPSCGVSSLPHCNNMTRTLCLGATSPMHTRNVPGIFVVSKLITCSLGKLDFGAAYVHVGRQIDFVPK
jgi:hypothetical protein